MYARNTTTSGATVVCLLAVAASAFAVEPKQVSFTTYDNRTIHADYYERQASETGAPMVILLHMYRSDRSAFRPLIDPLHNAGFAVLAVDLRGHGPQCDEADLARVVKGDTSVFKEMNDDVRAAYSWLAEQPGVDRSRFALVGASVGASVALEYSENDKSVDALVLMSPGVDYLGLDSTRPMRSIKGRSIWMIAAANDREKKSVSLLKDLYPAAKTEIVSGDYHGTHMFGAVPNIEKRIADYLKTNVGVPSNKIVYGSIRSNIYHLAGSGWIDEIKPWNMRHYSSAAEAESRGLRVAKNRGPNDKPPWMKRP